MMFPIDIPIDIIPAVSVSISVFFYTFGLMTRPSPTSKHDQAAEAGKILLTGDQWRI